MTESTDRRTRKRAARRDHLLDLAADLVEQHGVDGLTMAGLAEAADYATASLYTYFPSRSALLAALQQRALATLAEIARIHVAAWEDALARRSTPVGGPADGGDARIGALAKLWAFSNLFLAAPRDHPREFQLQQQLLVTPGAEDTSDAATVVPAAMAVLDVPRALLAHAVETGALSAHDGATDPIGQPIDGDVLRTFAWIVALNGALMVDSLTTGLPATGAALATEITASLLAGWGADLAERDGARVLAESLAAQLEQEGIR